MARNINNAQFRQEMEAVQPDELISRLTIGAGTYMLISSEPDELRRFNLAIKLSAQSMAVYLETHGVEIPASLMADFGLEPC